MKKLFMVLAFAGVSVASMAQDYDDATQKYSVATNSFWSNWFIQAGAEWNAWYSSEEHNSGNARSPFEGFRSSPAASIAIGKWFSPEIGLRTKLQGIWGKTVLPNEKSKFNSYWILSEHALFNLSNIICGYNPNRTWNFIPFAGAGIGRTMTHDLYSQHLSVGILNTFRVNNKLAINLELGWNRCESDMDGGAAYTNKNRGWETHDNDVYAEVGFTWNLGKGTWNAVPDVDAIKALSQSQIDALNAQLDDANGEIARLKRLLAEKSNVSPSVKEFITTPVSVFFNLDKTDIASLKDLVNVQALAKYAAANNSNILVTGYADSATGSVDHNQWLSEKRAEQVADEIVKMGVERSKIQTVGKGGVEILSPVSFNRRATVEITE